MSHVNTSLGYLLSRKLEEAEGSSRELNGSQYITDESFVAESCPPKWYIFRLRLGLKEVWCNVTISPIDVSYFCSKRKTNNQTNKTLKKTQPKVLAKKSPKIS